MQTGLFNNNIEKRLWESADQLRANSKLKSSEYSVPVLGLIFLRYADHKFTIAQEVIENKFKEAGSRRSISKADYQAKGVLYLPESARFSTLLNLPEGENIGRAINNAMKDIEAGNEDLKDVLPKTYNRLENDVLVTLLKIFSSIPMDIEGDVYEEAFWHLITKQDSKTGARLLDNRRAERLNWCVPIICNANDKAVKVWDFDEAGGYVRTYLWLEDFDYVVVLQKRQVRLKEVYFLITAFHVSGESRKRNLRKKYEKRKA